MRIVTLFTEAHNFFIRQSLSVDAKESVPDYLRLSHLVGSVKGDGEAVD